MLLTSGAQKFLTKALSSIAGAIRGKQQDDLDRWENTENKNAFSRGEHVGTQKAFETAYHIAKTQADESYSQEYIGADKRLLEIAQALNIQSKAMEKIINDSISCDDDTKNKILNQSNLLKNFSETIVLILKQGDE